MSVDHRIEQVTEGPGGGLHPPPPDGSAAA